MTEFLMRSYDMVGGVGVWGPRNPPWGFHGVSRRQLAALIRSECGLGKVILPKSCSENLFSKSFDNAIKNWRSQDDLVNRFPLWQPLKRRVSFADEEGLDLAIVHQFDQRLPPKYLFYPDYKYPVEEETPIVTATPSPEPSATYQELVAPAAEPPSTQLLNENSDDNASAAATAPGEARRTSLDVSLSFVFALMPRRDLNTVPVALTAVRYNDQARTLEGSISVLNMAFHKEVCIRFSWDGWATWAEQPATYACSPADCSYDVFAFSLPLLETAQVGSRLAFAVRFKPIFGTPDPTHQERDHQPNAGVGFECDDEGSYWDNNNGTDFEAVCTLPIPRGLK